MQCVAPGRTLFLMIILVAVGVCLASAGYAQEEVASPLLENVQRQREHIVQDIARQAYKDAASKAESLHSTLTAARASRPHEASDVLCLLGLAHFLAGDLKGAAASYERALGTAADASAQIGSYTLVAADEQAALRSYHMARAWTDSTGKHTTEACYVSHTDKEVLLSNSGTLRSVPVDRLSDADKEYLETLAEYAQKRTSQRVAIETNSLGRVERLANPDPAASAEVKECLREMEARKKLVYEYTNINVVTTWLNGTIPIGKELVFTKGRSEVPLDQGCKYAMLYFALVNEKRTSLQGIESQVAKVRSKISQLQAQQRQAQLQRVGFNASLLADAQAALANLATQHSAESAAFAKMSTQLGEINSTMNAALSRYIEAYSKASAAIATAADASLAEILSLLASVSRSNDGYGEALLFAQAALLSRTRLQEARDLIAQHKDILESSDGIGFSALNLSRLVLSALLGVEEDNADVLRMIARNKEAMKYGLTCHSLGAVYLAAGRYNSAESLLKRAYAKSSDENERFLIAADVCYTVLARDPKKTLADVEKYVSDVQHPAGVIDWRVERAHSMLASAEGEHSKAVQHARVALVLCPPAVEAELSRMVASAEMGQRFSFSVDDVAEPDQPVGLD